MEFSEKEIQMLNMIGVGDLCDRFTSDPLGLYRIAMERAFLECASGPHVDSMRRCIVAIRKCSVYRGTDEWDAMINCT